MISHTKPISDIDFQQYHSRAKSPGPNRVLPLMNAIYRRDCRSENYIHSRRINSTENFRSSTNDFTQKSGKVVDEQLIVERYPITNVAKSSGFPSKSFLIFARLLCERISKCFTFL